MKLIILFALIALAASAPVDEKKPGEDKPVEKVEDKQPAADEKKPEEKPEEKKEESKGLKWPLPDPDNEGELMLHGVHLFERVDELHKKKLEKDEEKMILSVGRDYLRRISKYIEQEPEFKVLPILCRDTERLNSSRRWEIRTRPVNQRSWLGKREAVQPKDANQNDPMVSSNSTHENATENINATSIPIPKERPSFEIVDKEYYRRVGDNFARVLMKRYRKEKLEKEESEYLDRWSGEESIHYGMMGIYCRNGENVKEITKRISTLIEEKP